MQLIALIFSFLMIYFAWIYLKKRIIRKIEFFSWFLIWSLAIFIIIFPDILRAYAVNVFISRLFDLMVVGGFILVIVLAGVSYIKTRKLENKFEDFVRKKALEERL